MAGAGRVTLFLATACLWQAAPLHSTTSGPPQRSPSLLLPPAGLRNRRLAGGGSGMHGVGEQAGHRVPRISLRGGGDEGGDAGEGGWGKLDMNAPDPSLNPTHDLSPWPTEDTTADDEKLMALGMREQLIMGRDKWYDDMFMGVPKKEGAYDTHEDSDDYEERFLDECKDESNPEGYLGAVDEERMLDLYPSKKEQFAFFSRNMSISQRPPQHRFKVGDMVTLAPRWRDPTLGNYTRAPVDLPGVPEVEDDLPFNDAAQGPLFGEDVGVVIEDDNSLKPYKVRAVTAQTWKEGYPSTWTAEWFYVAEALVKYTTPAPLNLPPDAEVCVPKHFPSVKLALRNLTEGQSVAVTGGDYRYDDVIEIGDHPDGFHPGHVKMPFRTLRMRGEDGARSWGRLILGRMTRGVFNNMVLLLTTTSSYKAVLQVHGGPWQVEECQVRSAGGVAIETLCSANVSCTSCGLGGFAWPIGPNCAADGVCCRDDSTLTLEKCSIDKTGRVGGIGLYARDRAVTAVVECQFVHNDHAIGYNDEAKVMVYNSSVRLSRNEAFYGGLNSLASTLILCASRIEGPPWFRRRLPGKLGLTSEYPGDNIIGPIPPHNRASIHATDATISLPTLDDRVYHRKMRNVPVHFDGDQY